MKKIHVSDQCKASGICTRMTDLLQKDANGKAMPAGSGRITDKTAEKFMDVIKSCPMNAISLKDANLVASAGTQGLYELKAFIMRELGGYKVPLPPRNLHTYNGTASSIPLICSKLHNQYKYNSECNAEVAGLNHFAQAAYSQAKTIVQKALVEFKESQLYDFIFYEKKQGNYYHDIHESLSILITNIVEELKERTEEKIPISVNIDRIRIGPEDVIVGEDLHLERLKNLEEFFADSVVSKLDPLQDYRLYINTDFIEDFRGKEVHCHDLQEAIEKFKGDIADAIKDVFNYDNAIEAEIEEIYYKFAEKLKKELQQIADHLIKAINQYLANYTI